jgi:heme exporter protein B
MSGAGSMWTAAGGVFHRDVLLAWRRRSDLLTTVFFFVSVASLFPLGVGPEPAMLRTIGPGVVWVAALLAGLLSMPRLFAADYQDGTLEQLLLVPHPLSVLVTAKIGAHWLTSGLPIVVLSPLLGMQFGMAGDSLLILMASLLLGTMALSFVGSIGSALTLGVRGSGLLVALLTLPLFIPILIFGAGAVASSEGGTGVEAHLSLLAACVVLAVVFSPWAAATAVRIALE